MPLYQFLKDNNITYSSNVLLSNLTGMNLLGSISLLAKPDSIEKLQKLYQYVIDNKYTHDIIGGLSNTYLCSSYNRDIVIQTTRVRDKYSEDNRLIVGCGYSLTKLSKELCQVGIAGYEGFVGIPGTVGAAAINNSGAFTSVMSKVVRSVLILDTKCNLIKLYPKDLKYDIRESKLKGLPFGVLLSVELDVSQKGNVDEINTKVRQYSYIRNRDIDGKRKSLGSIITGNTLPLLWEEHKLAKFIKKCLYVPFKYTKWKKSAQCVIEFLVLNGLRFSKYCDNIGRFCWTSDTTEKDFLDYIQFLKDKSNNKIKLEIEIRE